jgi:hypothetical protein
MAIVLEANYAKKLGLPNFSSHQYSVTIRTELNDLSQVEAESARLYRILQDAVDREMEEVGFLPNATDYGMLPPAAQNGDRHGNGHHPSADTRHTSNGNGAWRCSEKQRELIEDLLREKRIENSTVEEIAREMFGAGVKELNRLQASGLIDELLDRYGGGRRNGKQFYRRDRVPANGRGGNDRRS